MVGDNWQTYWGIGIYILVAFILFMEKSVRNPDFDDSFAWGFIAGFWPIAIILWAIEKVYDYVRTFLIFVYQKLINKVKHGK